MDWYEVIWNLIIDPETMDKHDQGPGLDLLHHFPLTNHASKMKHLLYPPPRARPQLNSKCLRLTLNPPKLPTTALNVK